MDATGNQRNLESGISGYLQDDHLHKAMDCARKTEKKRRMHYYARMEWTVKNTIFQNITYPDRF